MILPPGLGLNDKLSRCTQQLIEIIPPGPLYFQKSPICRKIPANCSSSSLLLNVGLLEAFQKFYDDALNFE